MSKLRKETDWVFFFLIWKVERKRHIFYTEMKWSPQLKDNCVQFACNHCDADKLVIFRCRFLSAVGLSFPAMHTRQWKAINTLCVPDS